MIARSSALTAFVITVLVLWIAPGSAFGAGGIYVDNFQVTNSGRVVFFDNFDDGDIRDWSVIDASPLCIRANRPTCWLHVNRHGKTSASAFHRINIPNPGVVELSASVWLAPVQEQYSWSHKTTNFTGLVLYSKSSASSIGVGARLIPKERGYRVQLRWNQPGARGTEACTDGVVLQPQRWTLLTIRLEPLRGRATALLNGREQVSIAYDSRYFLSFKHASVWGWLGDGSLLE